MTDFLNELYSYIFTSCGHRLGYFWAYIQLVNHFILW